jgi:hypothetical protein
MKLVATRLEAESVIAAHTTPIDVTMENIVNEATAEIALSFKKANPL